MRFYKKRYTKFKIITLSILILSFVMFINIRFIMLARNIANAKARYIALECINNSVNTYFENEQNAKDLIKVTYDTNGKMTTLMADSAKLNKIKGEISNDLIQRLSLDKKTEITVPITSIFGLSIFSGIGPRMRINVVPLSNIEANFENKFAEAGLNQTKLEINLNLKATIFVSSPILRSGVDVSTTLPITQTVILGEVPPQYTGINGANGNAADIALNLTS